VSTEDQAREGISLEAQREKARQYCQLYDLDLVAVEVDAGASGKTTDRYGLRSALAMLEAGEADGLLVVKLDRLTRSVKDLAMLLETYFASGQWDLLSVSENIDTTTAAGRLVLNVLVSVGQWEREIIGERTSEAMAHLISKGVKVGRPGLGWEYAEETDHDGHRIIRKDRSEAATVRMILRLRKQGLPLRAIADQLEAKGRKTKRGGRWQSETVRKVLIRHQGAA